MIVVDTSAIVSVLLGEPGAGDIGRHLIDSECVMSAVTRVELGIVIEARNGPAGTQLLEELLDRAGVRVEAVDAELAAESLVCWRRFGKGRHPAGLNFGDTFAYALARRLGAPLLFVGRDFSETDVLTVL